MHGDILVIGIAMLVGVAAIFYVVLRLAWELLAGGGRLIGRLLGVGHLVENRTQNRQWHRLDAAGQTAKRRICPNPHCRQVEYRMARFCSRCGTKIDGTVV